MTDTYWGITLVAKDEELQSRVTACAAQEGEDSPYNWTMTHQWAWAAQPTWAEKYEYALAVGVARPGQDPAVITDADILTAVQLLRADDAAGPPSGQQG